VVSECCSDIGKPPLRRAAPDGCMNTAALPPYQTLISPLTQNMLRTSIEFTSGCWWYTFNLNSTTYTPNPQPSTPHPGDTCFISSYLLSSSSRSSAVVPSAPLSPCKEFSLLWAASGKGAPEGRTPAACKGGHCQPLVPCALDACICSATRGGAGGRRRSTFEWPSRFAEVRFEGLGERETWNAFSDLFSSAIALAHSSSMVGSPSSSPPPDKRAHPYADLPLAHPPLARICL